MDNIVKILFKLGISPSLKGFKYIIRLVELVSDEPECKITALYYKVGKENNVTWTSVERCVRHCITYSVDKEPGGFYKYFGNLVDKESGTVSNKAFLCTIAFMIKNNITPEE